MIQYVQSTNRTQLRVQSVKTARLVIVVHVHCGLQGVVHLRLREDDVAGQAADTTGTVADGHLIDTRHTTAVGADAASVAHSIVILELLGWCEVQACESTGFTQQVTSEKVS